ncbi:MAG: Crp/Fnr family transcriptional regulator [Flavobacterium sp.]
MTLILGHIRKFVHLTPEEEHLLISKIEIKTIKAKSVLLHAGEVCKETYFVNAGLLRSYNVNDNIVEHILHFACEGWWMGDLYSLITQKPGNLFIEALEDSELIVLSKEKQEELYLEIPKLERFFRILTENSLVAHQERLMDNLSLSAEERFEKFCQKYPSLIQRVPQRQIASYIGVTPEFLSKLKKKILLNR